MCLVPGPAVTRHIHGKAFTSNMPRVCLLPAESFSPFLADCPPKSAMRMDSNRFADECRALTESWIESTWFFTLVVAVTCAVVGFGTMKLIRKQEKAKSGPGRTESDVTDLRSSFGGRKSNQAAELR